MRRWIVLALMCLAVLAPAPAFASGASDSGSASGSAVTTTSINNDFLDTKREISECLGNSIDLPDCGREPVGAGDRGGALQYVTFGILILAVSFIFWRVARSIKARDAALGSGLESEPKSAASDQPSESVQ